MRMDYSFCVSQSPAVSLRNWVVRKANLAVGRKGRGSDNSSTATATITRRSAIEEMLSPTSSGSPRGLKGRAAAAVAHGHTHTSVFPMGLFHDSSLRHHMRMIVATPTPARTSIRAASSCLARPPVYTFRRRISEKGSPGAQTRCFGLATSSSPKERDAKAETETNSRSESESEWESVIGIETHVQLDTNTKAFCSCKSSYGDVPNANVCPICLGHPGMMPSLNKRVVELAMKTALALGCTIHEESKFDRKQYFYGDLPKGYQISQNDRPIATDGLVEAPMFVVGKKLEREEFPSCKVRIHRLHIEEDTAKLTHQGADSLALDSSSTLADYNRAGVPLVEIVTEPDMRTGEEAAAYAQELRRIVRFLGVSSGNMQEGSLRCDVNISVRRKGTEALGTKVEVKNLNSFSAVRAAAEYELKRQSTLIEQGRGDEVVQETRLWDESKSQTQSMRSKEGAADYRYFREPDLPFLVLEEGAVEEVQGAMPELPQQVRERFLSMGLPVADTSILADDVKTKEYFDACVSEGANPKVACNWIVGDIAALLKEKKDSSIEDCKLTPNNLAKMIQLIEDGTISGKIAKQILPELLETGEDPEKTIEKKGLVQISDSGQIEELIQGIIDSNPKQLEQYRSGKTKLFGFFVGQVMKASKGRANPKLVNDVLKAKLDGK